MGKVVCKCKTCGGFLWFKEIKGFKGEVVRFIAECRLCEAKRITREKERKQIEPIKKKTWFQRLFH